MEETTVIANPQTPEPSGIQKAVEAARARLANAGSLVPAEPPAAPETPPAAEPAPETPPAPVVAPDATGRLHDPETGKFVEKPADAAPAAETPPTEVPPVEDTPPEAPPADTPAMTVTLPGRRPGEELTMEVDSQETLEGLNRLRNGFLRGEEVRAERANIALAQDEVDNLREQLTTDPLTYLRQSLPPEVQRAVALSLILDEAHFEDLKPHLEAILGDDRERQVVVARLEAEQYRLRDGLKKQADERRQWNENARQITTAIAAVTPDGFNEEQADIFLRDCVRDVQDYIARSKANSVHVADLPTILGNRLRLNGMEPTVAARTMADALAPASPKLVRTPPKPAAGRSPASVSTASSSQPTGEQLKAAAAKLRAAAAVPSAGGGPPAIGPSAPAGQTVAERAAWARKHGLFPKG